MPMVDAHTNTTRAWYDLPCRVLRVDDPHAGYAAFGVVVVETLDDGVGDHGEVAGLLRRRQRGRQRREIGAVAAAALASAAQLARAAAERDVFGRGLGQMRAAPDGNAPRGKFRFDLVLECGLKAVERHRRQELPVRQLCQSFVRARDSGEALDAVVPGRDVGVANRPVDAMAILPDWR